jgi:tRNA-specific 2-thiouridylase
MEAGLVTAEKKDSQGLCFIGKVSLPEFLQQQLEAKTGKVIEIPVDAPQVKTHAEEMHTVHDPEKLAKHLVFHEEDGKEVGTHRGAHFYTIGQRKGLSIGGMERPLFVLQTDVRNNLLFVGQGEDHPALASMALAVDAHGMHWVRPDKALTNGESRAFKMRIRYRQPLFEGTLHCIEGHYFATFSEPQKAVTPGQFLAIYEADELIGSAIID